MLLDRAWEAGVCWGPLNENGDVSEGVKDGVV